MKGLLFKWRWFLMIGMLLVIVAVSICMIQTQNSVKDSSGVPNRMERVRTAKTIQNINSNSKLPIPLLTEDYHGAFTSLEEQFGTENVERIPTYMSDGLGLKDGSVFLSFTGYPEDRDKYRLVEESINEIDRGCSVLGITVGSSYEEGMAILKTKGFQAVNDYGTFSKGEVRVILDKDDVGVINCICIKIETYYTSGLTY
ncbi:MAG: hypothetical protein F8N38_07420 [Hungatella sp.]|nr:hypothetical protein [Hungatella sp.]